jgi:hypothetical protein
MVLVAQGIEEEKFYYYFAQNIYFWQAFLLILWSFFTSCKGYDYFQTLTSG